MTLTEPDLNTPVNYYTYFRASLDKLVDILSFVKYLVSESVYQRVAADKKYAPSAAWRSWASGAFVGVSGDLLMTKSGHRMLGSHEAIAYVPVVAKRHSFVQYLRKCVSKLRSVKVLGDLDRHIRSFSNHYSDFQHPPDHSQFPETHGFVYLRMLEVYNLMKLSSKPEAVIEIGAGAAVLASLMRSAFECKCVVVDLPETIPTGYADLKTVFPELRVALPNVIQRELASGERFESFLLRYDVVFILPFQTRYLPTAWFDMGVNVSSFQEMNIDVVNEYLSLVRRVLKLGGSLVLENLKKSRETNGNGFDGYCLDGFELQTLTTPWYANFVVRHVPGLDHFFYQGRKP